jgi:DNA transformation protein
MMQWKPPHDSQPVSRIRNLGPKSALMLAEAGVRTVGELRELGAVKAYCRVKELRKRGASVNLLWSLAAGLDGRSWQEVSAEEKASLLAEVRRLRR